MQEAVETDELQAIADRIFESWRHLVNGPAKEVSAAFYGEGEDACDVAQVEVLEVLLDGEGLRMTDLAKRMRVDTSTMTRTIDRMTKHGLVERTSRPGDDRIVVVRITPVGEERCRRILEARARIMREYTLELGEGQAEVLATLMEHFVDGVARTVERRRGMEGDVTTTGEPEPST